MTTRLNTRFYILILVYFLMGNTTISAQLYVKAESLTVRDGLSDNRVTSILKDQNGFMWVGTRNGLNRYDGHSFKIFRPAQQNSISNEIINDIVNDDSGFLWVATMDGLNRYQPGKDTWWNIYPVTEEKETPGLPNNLVWDIYVDQENRLWIVSDVRELTFMDLKTGIFRSFDWPGFARNHPVIGSTTYRSIQKILPGKKGQFYLGTNRGLVSFDIASGQFAYLGGHYNASVSDMRYDAASGILMLVTDEGEVIEYRESDNSILKKQVENLPYPSKIWMQPAKEDYWLASPRGLLQWQRSTEKIWLHQNLTQMEGYILAGGVNKVFEEMPGVQWVGTPNGLNRLDWGGDVARFIPLAQLSLKDGNNAMGGVYYDKPTGEYFICGGSLNKVFIITIGNSILSIDKDATGRSFGHCNMVIADTSGRLWLLTENDIYLFDKVRRTFRKQKSPPPRYPYNFRDLVQLPDGKLLLAAFSSGLWTYDPEYASWQKLENGNFQYANKPTSLCMDTIRGRIWVGTFSHGLFYLDLKTGLLNSYSEPIKGYGGHVFDLINDVVCDKAGKIIVATDAGGVLVLNPNRTGNANSRRYSMREGLLSNNFLSVAAGDNGEIWAISGRRVHYLDSNGNNILPLLANRLMPISTHASDQRLTHSIFFNERKKELLLASGGGLILVPGQKRSDSINFPIVFTEINMGNGWLRLFAPHPQSGTRIPYRSNSIAFSYAALQFKPDAGIRYQHKLEGYESQWEELRGPFKAIYSNLPPGEYRFVVRALFPSGEISPGQAHFSFSVVPPFWRTWWFIVGVSLLLLFGLYGWIHSLRENVRTQKILTYFATSLYGQNTVVDIFWDIARNCIGQLKFEDCVIYQYDEEKQLLVQRAAFGPKSPSLHELINPMEIPIGTGIVGHVAQTLRSEIVNDTSRDSRYIVDDNSRFSEMAVPIIVDGKLFGVIDSENPRKGFYTNRHLKLMTRIAEIGAAKISKYLIEERIRLKIARDLHDEMGSTLTSINIISKMAMEQAKEQPLLFEQLLKIKDRSARIMDSMSDIVWAINPANDNFEKTILRMKEFAAEILEPAGINYYFKEDPELTTIALDIEKRKELYMLFKEAVTNAAKYSQATEVNISLRLQGGHLLLAIIDNGVGFKPDKLSQGNGIRNMRNRATQMRADLRLDSIPKMGTSIQVTIPIT